MATFTNLRNNDWYLSSNLTDATGTITGMDEARIELTMFYEHPFFSTDISVKDTKWTLYDLRSLVEGEMRRNGLSYARFDLDIDHEDHVYFNVIYSRYRINYGATFLQQRQFLAESDVSAVYPGSGVYLPFIVTQAEGESILEFDLLTTDQNGRYNHKKWAIGQDRNDEIEEYERLVEIDWETVVYQARGETPRALTITGTTDQDTIRRHQIYCVNRKPDLVLAFRNRFNAWECAPLFGELTAKTENERELANIGDKRIFYDLQTKRTFQFDSTALTRAECQLLQELIASHDVRIFDADNPDEPNYMTKILITDSECELSDSNDELPHIQITFEYDSNTLYKQLERHIPYPPSKIFSPPFDDTFA